MFTDHLKSRFFRWLITLLAVLTAVFPLTGCTGEEIDTALSVLEVVLSDSEESAPSEQFSPSESANAPPESSSVPGSKTESKPTISSKPSSDSSDESPRFPQSPAPLESSNIPDSPLPEFPSEPSSPSETKDNSTGIDEDGWYSSKDEVALYLHTFERLPGNYLTKKEASALGWDSKKGNLWEVAEGMSIGGDTFGNREGLLPSARGRKWYECDINYQGGFRGAERILFSNDGLIYYTDDHYQSYTQLY